MKPNLKVGEAWPGGFNYVEDVNNWDSTNFNINHPKPNPAKYYTGQEDQSAVYISWSSELRYG